MPRFDDRFARQNRFGPPSGFPLTSSYPGIVHHLSGPNIYAPTQTFHQRIVVGRWCPLRFPPFTFIAHPGFATRILAYMLDSLVRVSRRVELQDHVKLHKNTSGSVTNARSRCPKVLQLTVRNSSIGSLIPHSLQ